MKISITIDCEKDKYLSELQYEFENMMKLRGNNIDKDKLIANIKKDYQIIDIEESENNTFIARIDNRILARIIRSFSCLFFNICDIAIMMETALRTFSGTMESIVEYAKVIKETQNEGLRKDYEDMMKNKD